MARFLRCSGAKNAKQALVPTLRQVGTKDLHKPLKNVNSAQMQIFD